MGPRDRGADASTREASDELRRAAQHAARAPTPSTHVLAHAVTMVFAGYQTPKPKDALGDYRTIGRFRLVPSYPEQGDERGE